MLCHPFYFEPESFSYNKFSTLQIKGCLNPTSEPLTYPNIKILRQVIIMKSVCLHLMSHLTLHYTIYLGQELHNFFVSHLYSHMHWSHTPFICLVRIRPSRTEDFEHSLCSMTSIQPNDYRVLIQPNAEEFAHSHLPYQVSLQKHLQRIGQSLLIKLACICSPSPLAVVLCLIICWTTSVYPLSEANCSGVLPRLSAL